MTTLDANRQRLVQLQRSRAIADALTAQALKPREIRHPYQGMAQLAEALAGGLLGIQNAKYEKEAAEERRQAMIEALGPQTQEIVIPQEQNASPVQPQQIWQDPNQAGMPMPQSSPVGKSMEVTTPGILNQQQLEMLMSLPPDEREAVWAKTVLHQFTPDPTKRQDPYDSVGNREIRVPGQEPYEAEVLRDNRSGLFVLMDANNRPIPVDARHIGGPITRSQDVPVSVAAKYAEQFAAAQSTLGEINRLGDFVARGGLAQESNLGAAFAMAEGVRSTFAGLYDRFEILVGGKPVRDTGQLAKAQTFAGYGDASVTERDKRRYSGDTIKQNLTAWQELQKLDAATQQLAISIAYSLARIADPGGRLSEMDVLNQIRSLGLQQASVERRLSALTEARITFADQVYNRYANLKANGIEVSMDPALMNDIMAIRSGEYPDFQMSGASVYVPFLEDPTKAPFFSQKVVDEMRKASPQVRRQYEKDYGLPAGIYDHVINGK